MPKRYVYTCPDVIHFRKARRRQWIAYTLFSFVYSLLVWVGLSVLVDAMTKSTTKGGSTVEELDPNHDITE